MNDNEITLIGEDMSVAADGRKLVTLDRGGSIYWSGWLPPEVADHLAALARQSEELADEHNRLRNALQQLVDNVKHLPGVPQAALGVALQALAPPQPENNDER